jgi:F-type H+-transporting ATPase subunit epsilon
MTLSIRIVTPGGLIWEGLAQSVILPSVDGAMGILPGHIPVTTTVKFGLLKLQVNWQWRILFISEGFVQIEEDDITILVNVAEWSNQIDPLLAQADLETAQASLLRSQTRGEKFLANKALKVAKIRLRAAKEFQLAG